ncbi:protein kinase domain-containing protein [Zavarzinia sp. CC-PAN008]|uniref:protein kinase domain-containing protein n=1 Tax=Zavarzinia sp. CC-PAN008 TaxID=3243332 RepID=UPI003F7437D1
MTVVSDALPPATELNGYRLDSVLGRGGFGITYRALQVKLNRVVAIKEYFPSQFALRSGRDVLPKSAEDAEDFDFSMRRFLQEAQVSARLAAEGRLKDGIAAIYDFFEANCTAYIVMEFVEGESLEKLLRQHPEGLPEDQLLALLGPLLDSLEAIHASHLLHRDVKPDNIFVRPNGRAVLLDFGAARDVSPGHNKSFTMIASMGYSPIEQFFGLRQGPYSDIYALGAVLYRAVTGKKPPEATVRDTKIRRGQVDPIRGIDETALRPYTRRFTKAIMQALELQPERRPQSIAELRGLLGLGPVDLPPVDTPSITRRSLRLRATEIELPEEDQVPAPLPIRDAEERAAEGEAEGRTGHTSRRRGGAAALPPRPASPVAGAEARIQDVRAALRRDHQPAEDASPTAPSTAHEAPRGRWSKYLKDLPPLPATPLDVPEAREATPERQAVEALRAPLRGMRRPVREQVIGWLGWTAALLILVGLILIAARPAWLYGPSRPPVSVTQPLN